MEIEKSLGGDAELSMEFSEGKLKLKIGIDTKGVDAGVFANFEPEYFIDKLAEAIPGEVDDAIFAMLKVALKK